MNLKRYNLLRILVLLTVFVFFAPVVGRMIDGNYRPIGSEAYLHLRYAEELSTSYGLSLSERAERYSSIPDQVYSRRPFYFSPFDFLIAIFGVFIDPSIAILIIPLLLGIASVFMLRLLLLELGIDAIQTDLSLLFLVSSPAFLFPFLFSTANSLVILIGALSAYFFIKKNPVFFLLALALIYVESLFSIYSVIILIFVLLSISSYKPELKRRWMISALFLLLVLFKTSSPVFVSSTSFSGEMISELLSDLGGFVGFGVFAIFLGAIGLFRLWKERSQSAIFLLAFLIIISFFFVGSEAFIFLSFFIALASAKGFLRLINNSWNLSLIKNLTLIILICGLLFSTVSYLNRVVSQEPNESSFKSLEFLREVSSGGDIVLSHHKYGYWIQFASGRQVLADSLSTYRYDQQFLYKVEESVFQSRDLFQTLSLLRKYSIDYIWITPEMKEGLVWTRDDDGLLFLFENSETFKRVYSEDGYEIWKVLK